MTESVWDIEQDNQYKAWLKQVEDRHPRLERDSKYQKAGTSTVGRTLVLAEERDGVLHVGVLLSTGDEFWKPWPGMFDDLVQENVREGGFMNQGWQNTADHFSAWTTDYGPAKRLEFCSSHVGGFIVAIMTDGTRVTLDEC